MNGRPQALTDRYGAADLEDAFVQATRRELPTPGALDDPLNAGAGGGP